jgi:hypothetical protein
MRLLAGAVAAALMLVLWQAPARANDSMAEVAIGGLVLKDSDQISLDKEDLYLSRDEVRVDYLFTNTGGEDVEALVAFPLPDQNYGDESANLADFRTALDFRTTVDGEPVDYDITVQAILDGRDVTADLAAFGFEPYTPQTWDDYDAALKALTPEQMEDAVSQGFLENGNTPEDPYYHPRWLTRTIITRTQVFPAGQTVAVSHRYKPVVGGSVGGALNAEYRNEDWGKEHAGNYCIEDDWFAAFDRALAKRATTSNPSPYTEFWLGYVLSTGANWKGPIKDFRLVVDKGKPENLISLCAEGVKKISPTQFEVNKTDFEPAEDLKILIVEWYEPEE